MTPRGPRRFPAFRAIALGVAAAAAARAQPSVERSFATNRVSSAGTYVTQLTLDPGATPPFALVASELLPDGWTVQSATWNGEPIDTNVQGRTNKWAFSELTQFPVGTGVLLYATQPAQVIEPAYAISGVAVYSGTSVPVGGDATLFPLDQDGDALPDDWERLYFGGSPTAAEPLADDDGDGGDNLNEYRARTAPRDASSFLGWTSIAVTHGQLQLRWRAGAGSAVKLFHASTLGAPAAAEEFYYAEHATEGERQSPPLPLSEFPPPRYFRLRLLNGR